MGRSRRSYEWLMKFWKLGHVFDGWPLLDAKSSEKTTSGHMLPINAQIETGKNTVLPMDVLRPLIERADGVAILNECVCRRGQKCDAFPRSSGCLLLGGAIHDVDPSLARIVSPEEAVSHAASSIDMGLVPLVVHEATDAWIWGIDYRRMMNVCFCCDCCCDVRISVRRHKQGFFENIHRLPGLSVAVTGQCDACGICREVCMADAVTISGEIAHIGKDCKGCGRCVAMCPRDAITMSFDAGVDTVAATLKKYEDRTDVGPISGPLSRTGSDEGGDKAS